MEIITSKNNNLENVLILDHPFKQKVKKRGKKNRPRPASCEEPMQEEVTDASEQVMPLPISSLVETSLSKPNIGTVSRVPVDMEIGASKSNNLESVLTLDHPVNEKVKKRGKKKRPRFVSCNETMKEEVTDASKPGAPASCYYLLETTSSDPTIVPASGDPVDSKMSASSNNILEYVLMDDHPIKQQVKKKNEKKRPKPVSSEATLNEEVTDASKQGMQNRSLVETSLHNPNIGTVSGIPVDMEISASKNNEALVADHPVKQQVEMQRKTKRHRSVTCEATIKDEELDASKQGTPVSSLVDTIVSNPTIVSASGVTVDMKMSASSNNILENVLIDDHPVKQQVKKKNKKTRLKPVSFEDDASEQVMPNRSLVETSLHNPNIGTVSGVPVDMEISASKNNEVLVDDHPVKQQVEKQRRTKRRRSITCEETIKEEVVDASKRGTPTSSLVDTLVSNPTIVSASGVAVDMKMSASSNNKLENVLIDDHPVKQQVKKKNKKKCLKPVSFEDDASEQGMPNRSLVETSLHNPNIGTVSAIPADMEISSSKNNEVLVEQQVQKQRKTKRRRSVTCVETIKEEVVDASKRGTPTSFLVDTLVSNPTIVSASGVTVDMKMNASCNNKLEKVLIDDHPLKQQVKKKNQKKRPRPVSFDEPVNVGVTCASKQGMPISSVVETSLDNLNIVTVSGTPVSINIIASRNDDVVSYDHRVPQQVKKKPKKKGPTSVSGEEVVKEEVADPSKPGTLVTYIVETSLSNPKVLTKTSVSSNNDVKDVLVDDNPVKEKVKKQKKKRSKSSSCEEPKQKLRSMTNKTENIVESALATKEDGSLLAGNADSHLLHPLQFSSESVLPNSRRKLLVLDVNGILVDIVVGHKPQYKPDTKVASKAVFKRPFCDEFLQFCFERFDVGIWSSRTQKNLNKAIDFLMGDMKNRLLFCWDQSHCTATGYNTIENRAKPLVLKELKYLWWEYDGECPPWGEGYYNETNTILLDDSPYKALRNPPNTAIFPLPYAHWQAGDNSLGPDGDLRVYLERLAEASNVQKFIQENPFGQKPISASSRGWLLYSKIIGMEAKK